MNSIAFLKAAYVISWVIYVGYMGRILVRLKTVEAERKELERSTRASD